MTDLIMPTDEQVEELFKLVTDQLKNGKNEMLTGRTVCRAILVAMLNKDKILGDQDPVIRPGYRTETLSEDEKKKIQDQIDG